MLVSFTRDSQRQYWGYTMRGRRWYNSSRAETYSRIKLSAAEVSENGNINGERHAECEGNVEQFADIGCWCFARGQLVGASCIECDLSAGEGEGEKHECSDELADECSRLYSDFAVGEALLLVR